ncbi:MAG: hypothetical protein EOP83_17335 [Verrucomicrobiaceae bacterium]|nr:MAG: hypothetical protein EOP83_17335 [Verrucomicrobiaceae bacterium]
MDMRSLIALCESQIVTELQGIKQDAATVFDSKDHVVEFMVKKGFTVLGQGQWGAVFDHPDFKRRYVLKLFSDRYYEAFVNACIVHPGNPHLPRFFGKVMKVTDTARMVRIEKLKPFNSDQRTEEFLDDVGFEIAERGRITRMQTLAAENLGLSELLPTMLSLGENLPEGAIYDIHAENIMKRGNTLVITDPWGGDHIPFLR